MPTYLLARAARVNGARYERGDELPEHDHTTDLLNRGYASTDADDLLIPPGVPSIVAGDPKASERSTVLVSDSTGVHREGTAQPVTNSGDTGRARQVAAADAEAAAEADAADAAAKTSSSRRK